MVESFATEIVKKEPRKDWVAGFLKRHVDKLELRYLQPLDKERKKAENYYDIEMFYQAVQQKVEQYGVLAENTYNVDKKGLMIGFMQKSKRIFTKGSYTEKKLVGTMQDGNREWITILACICADQTALPPALIYKAVSGNLQDSWLQNFDAAKYSAFFTSSPNGLTDNKLGSA